MKYALAQTNQFRKDLKLAKRQGRDIRILEALVDELAKGNPLPPRNHDHALTGEWADYRECHIQPDWLLVYFINRGVLVLTLARTGTHSTLFKC